MTKDEFGSVNGKSNCETNGVAKLATAGILLAAGKSERFGKRNKLLANYGGTPLIAHAAAALRKATR